MEIPIDSADTINEVKYRCLACGSIHQGQEQFTLVMTLEEGKRFLYVWLLYLYVTEYFLPTREKGCQDVDQVLLHGDHFFLSAFSSSKVLGKNASIRCKLPTAACPSQEKREEGVKPAIFKCLSRIDFFGDSDVCN